MKPADIEEMFRRFATVNPNPRGELNYINPYTLLVAVALSAQATDASVNKATEPLFKVAKTPGAMVKLGEARLRDYIRTIGLFNTKAKNVIKLSQMLIDEHGGEVPPDAAALERLPGVGQKTAKVVTTGRRPTAASPPAAAIIFCSAIPNWIMRSGCEDRK